jgi:hypothetical protein
MVDLSIVFCMFFVNVYWRVHYTTWDLPFQKGGIILDVTMKKVGFFVE